MKVVVVSTHGFSVTEGTEIHCRAIFNNIDAYENYAFLYDNKGKLVEAKGYKSSNRVNTFFMENVEI